MNTVIAVDLETTGLVPAECAILEVSMHRLGDDLEILDSFEGVLGVPLGVELSDFIIDMHTRSGLLVAPVTCTLTDVGAWLSRWEKVVLLGASVHFDKSFLVYHLAGMGIDWHYRIIDVSSMKELYDITAGDGEREAKHRAHDDIMYSLALARRYRARIKGGTAAFGALILAVVKIFGDSLDALGVNMDVDQEAMIEDACDKLIPPGEMHDVVLNALLEDFNGSVTWAKTHNVSLVK